MDTENTNSQTSKGPFFGKIPQRLLRDEKISIRAKFMFGLRHTFCKEKDFEKGCVTFVSQKTLGIHSGLHPTDVSKCDRELHNEGWITIIRRGEGKTNRVVLHGERKRR